MKFEWRRHRHTPPATAIVLWFKKRGRREWKLRIEMSEPLLIGQTVSVIGTPVISVGPPIVPSLATLSSPVYTSSDPTVFTVAPDPSTPNGAIITAVGVGTATLTETATGTEASGATESLQGVDTIVVSAVPPPPPPPATQLVFTYGTPQGT